MIRTLATALATGSCIIATGAPAMAQSRDFNIPASSLKSALGTYVRQSGRQLIFKGSEMAGVRSNGARGVMSAEAALSAILAGSGFAVKTDASGAAAIVRTSRSGSANASHAAADADEGAAEIVVTAQKREERLQDVPVPVTVVEAQTLADTNQTRIQDYYTKIPGLSLVMAERGQPSIVIRGVTTGAYQTPTVGVVIDELAYGASTSGGSTPPDIDPSDLEQVEVLRGPQGTLYGASSIGGLIKFVTVKPDTRRLGGRLQVGVNTVEHGDGLGYVARGGLNIPLAETFAVRASGFYRHDAGYVDNVQSGEKGVNRTNAKGARVSALWKPSEDLSIQLSAMWQQTDRKGSDEIESKPGLDDFQQSRLIGSGGYRRESQVYSALVKADLGNANLTSVTGYLVDESGSSLDLSEAFGFFATLPPFNVTGADSSVNERTKKFSQEFRLDVPINSNIDWLAGLYFTKERSQSGGPLGGGIYAVNAQTGAVAGIMYGFESAVRYSEYAAFTDLTFRFGDRFDVQVGGRYSRNRQRYQRTFSGPLSQLFYGSDPLVGPLGRSKDNAFTYLLTPRFKITPDIMAYARFASGYRAGGPNAASRPAGATFPSEYKADTTDNYEIGLKGSVLHGHLSFDLSAYRIDWKDIQINIYDPSIPAFYRTNAALAKSEGIELSLTAKPWVGMILSGWIAYNNAILRSNFPAGSIVNGKIGDRLPNSSPWSGSISADQSFSLNASAEAFAGGSISFVDNRIGSFRSAPVRQIFPGYTQIDLRAGVRFDNWSINAYVNNLTDKRGVLRGGLDNTDFPLAFNYTQPRTIGISLAKSF